MTKTAKVNGERIRALRSKRGLSQKELAGKVKVDPGTVSRWERGEIDRVRHDVFGRLRAVLSASEADICGEGPLPENSTTHEASAPKGQMNLSVDTACRNALNLVALRYGVTRQQIVEAAPLLFYIVAEQSLKQRRECLRRLEDAADTLVALRPAHLLPHWPLNEEVLGSEEDSIEHRDLFGSSIPPFVVGRVHWDHWLVWKARECKHPVIDVSPVVIAVHQNHDYGYHPQGRQGVWHGIEAGQNHQLAGNGRHLRTIADATEVLHADGFKSNRKRYWSAAKRAAVRGERFLVCDVLQPVAFFILGITRPLRRALGMRSGTLRRTRGNA